MDFETLERLELLDEVLSNDLRGNFTTISADHTPRIDLLVWAIMLNPIHELYRFNNTVQCIRNMKPLPASFFKALAYN